MTPQRWMAFGALWAAIGVALGAFGAHALEERLDAEALADWETAVRYQLVHALALVLWGLFLDRDEKRACCAFVPWALLVGSVLFSGSIYCLALDIGSSFVWPLTPLGGLGVILGWLGFAWSAWRAPARGAD